MREHVKHTNIWLIIGRNGGSKYKWLIPPAWNKRTDKGRRHILQIIFFLFYRFPSPALMLRKTSPFETPYKLDDLDFMVHVYNLSPGKDSFDWKNLLYTQIKVVSFRRNAYHSIVMKSLGFLEGNWCKTTSAVYSYVVVFIAKFPTSMIVSVPFYGREIDDRRKFSCVPAGCLLTNTAGTEAPR